MPRASAAISAFGSGAIAAASESSGKYNAQVALNNQQTANANADLAVFKGNAAEQQSRQRTAQTIGSERAGMGASGFDVNSGSNVRTQADTARIGAIDADTIAQNAARSAWGYRTQAANFGAEAALDKAKGTQGAIASLIGGGANFADKWSKWSTAGVGTGGGAGADGFSRSMSGNLSIGDS